MARRITRITSWEGKQRRSGGGANSGSLRHAQGSAPCLVPPTGRSAVTRDPEGVATGLGKDGNSEESFPAKAGGLGVPPGCKCPKRETVGVGWVSSATLTDEAGQLQGPTPGGFESSGSSRSGSDPLQEMGKLSPVKPSNPLSLWRPGTSSRVS